jgi:predicted Holliday junction resolvase-like endonuclease
MSAISVRTSCEQCNKPVEANCGFELVDRTTGISVLFCTLRCVMEWCLDEMTAADRTASVRASVGTVLEAVREVDNERRRTRARENTAQRSAVAGKVFQLLAPHMADFPYNPLDCVPLSGPIDWLVYDGLTAGQVERLVFLENKLGGSQLSGRQRQVKRILDALCVRCQELVAFGIYSRNMPLIGPRRVAAEPISGDF